MTPEKHIIDWIKKNREDIRYMRIANKIGVNSEALRNLVRGRTTIDRDNFMKNNYDKLASYFIRFGYYPILKEEITINEINEKICKYFGIRLIVFHSKNRKKEIVQARRYAMFYSKELTKYSLSKIGREIGNKDHATVMYHCKKLQGFIDIKEKETIESIENLDKIFGITKT